MGALQFLAVGDITTDAFIRLKDARVNCNISDERCEICLRFADKVPYESVTEVPAVGNSPNAAVAAKRLGLRSALLTNIGGDYNGEMCMQALEREGIDTTFVRVEPERETNYHYVLWYEDERTILVKHHEFTYSLPDIGEPSWVYLSSLGESSLDYQHEIARYVSAHPNMKLAFQPGTFQIKVGTEALKEVYAASEIFFCNRDEAARILGRNGDVQELFAGIHALGPRIVVITDGPKGATASDGASRYTVPMYPDPHPPLDRTGAGDAFSSTVVSALALGEPLEKALAWGPVNSMNVVQEIGAQKGLLTRAQLESYIANAPSEYRVTRI